MEAESIGREVAVDFIGGATEMPLDLLDAMASLQTTRQIQLFSYIILQTYGQRRSRFQYESLPRLGQVSGIKFGRRIGETLRQLKEFGLIDYDLDERVIEIADYQEPPGGE